MNKLFKVALLASGSLLSATPALAAIDVNASFTPATRYPGEDSRLTIVLQNSSLDPTTSVNVDNVLPDDVFISAVPDLTNDCGGTITATNTATFGQVTLAGGIIPAGDGTNPGSCTIAVNVNSQKKGTYINTIPVGGLTGITNGTPEANATASQATLAVILQDLDISMTADMTYIQGYETTVRRITISNPNPVPLTNLSFYQDLWANGYNVRIRDDLPMGSTCGASLAVGPRPARSSAYGPTSDLTVTGGTLPANGSCEVFFTIEPSRDPLQVYSGSSLNNTLPAGAVTTDQGATNLNNAVGNLRTYTGAVLYKYFNNSSATSININDTDTATLRLTLRTYNTQAISGINVSDYLPAGMTVESVNSNTCGGTIVTSPNTELTLSGGTLNGAAANLNGAQTGSCDIFATVKVPAAGSYTNTIPTGAYDGSQQFTGDTATLTVNGAILAISKTFSRSGTIYAGDTVNLNFSITNFSSSTPITNLTIPDDLTTMGAGFRIGSLGLISNSCGGTGTVVPDATSFTLSGLAIGPGETCSASLQLITSSDMVAKSTTGTSTIRTNTIPVGDITYDTPTSTGQVFNLPVSGQARVYYPVLITKSFSPNEVGPLGISRMRVNINRYSSDRISMENISVLDNLPAGHEVAPLPNVFNGCGGTVSAVPGSGSVQLSGADIQMTPTGSSFKSCYFELDIRAPALTPGFTEETSSNIIPGDNPAGPRVYFSANDVRQAAPYNEVWNRRSASALLTRKAAAVTTSKEFIPATINGGGQSRVRITFSNTDSTAIDLSGVGLTDDFGSTDLRLYSNVNPTFTDQSGNPNSNGCYGGVFSGNAGDTQFTLSDARIDQFAICKLEFNVTAFRGGNHINIIRAGDLVSAEGVTNPADVSATLTVGYQIGVGKGFSPSVIEAGAQSTLTLDIYNTNVVPNDQTGASPAIIDTMPAGLQIVPGSAATSCAGGTASAGVDGSGNSFLRLDGGLFPASGVCQVTAQVTSSTTGTYLNQIPVGALQSNTGSQSPDPAEATLRVIQPPTIVKSFGPNVIAAGESSTITFTISNPNNAAALPAGMNGIGFSDVLSNMTISAPLSLGGTCSGYTTDAAIGATSFNVANISLNPGASCTFTLPVTSSVVGVHDNQTSGATSNQTVAAGAPSNVAQLRVLEPLTLTKSFAASAIEPDVPVRMTFTVTNPNPVSTTLSNPAFTDLFPTTPGTMRVAPVPNLSSTCSGATIRDFADTHTVAADDPGVLVRNGTVPASSSCEIGLDVVVSSGGAYTNTTSVLTSYAGESPAASANIFGISIVATDDAVNGINGVSGGSAVLNVLSGDAINSNPATTGNSTLAVAASSSVPAGLSFDISTGDVDVVPATPAGTYSFDYTICETANSLNCTTATVSVTVAASADLSVTKTNTPGVNGEADQASDSVVTGTSTTYTIVVTNNGPDAITGALVKDTVGSGLTCVAGDPVTISGDGVPSGSFTIGDLTGAGITLDALTDGQSTTISYSCEVN